MKPVIRCAALPNGNIEAAFMRGVYCVRLVIDPRFGNVIDANVEPGTDEFRRLVRAAREHLRP